jgi:hypothetical protein
MATITQTPVVPVSRKLGTLEKFFSLVDRHRPVHFAVAAHILGRTTISACRTALDALQERHPLFSVGIEQPIGGLPRFRSTTVPIAIRIVDPRLSTWQAEMARELANPFRTRQAPLMRAVLLHRTNESTLILTAHHSIANGLSLSYAMRDVLQALRGETLQPLPSLPAQEPLMYMLQEESAGDGDSAQSEPIQESQPVAFRPLNGSLPSIEALSLSSQLTDRLVEISRREGTTVHGALCSALVLAGQEISSAWDRFPVRILSPFSLRKQLGVGEDCGLFVWAGIVPMDPPASADFWDLARYAKSSLTAKQSPQRVAREMKGLEQALEAGVDVDTASQILAQGFPCELLLTNLGSLPIQADDGGLKLKSLWGPAVLMGFEGEQTVGVTTTSGALSLLHTSFAPLPSLLQGAERILRSACDR